jgi:serine/threonine-protein kinase RsbT
MAGRAGPVAHWQMSVSLEPRTVRVQIRDDTDVFVARRIAKTRALEIGFPLLIVQELVIVVSELAWNIIKHGGGGELAIFAIDDPERGPGIVLDARDSGPPFFDFAQALVDGSDDRGPIDPVAMLRRRGIGGGLGAVRRFSDELGCIADGASKTVRAVRYVRRRRG